MTKGKNWIELKTEQAVRKWATQEHLNILEDFGQTRIPDEIWNELRDQALRCIGRGDIYELEDEQLFLLEALKTRLDAARLGWLLSLHKKNIRIGPPRLSEYEELRSKAFNEWLLEQANRDQIIARIRSRYTVGASRCRMPVTSTDAINWLREQDCRGTPYSVEEQTLYATLPWPPLWVKDVPLISRNHGEYFDPGNDSPTDTPVEDDGRLDVSGTRLVYRVSGTLASLIREADQIGGRYFWNTEQTLWFILTGIAPELPPLTIGFSKQTHGIEPNTVSQTILTINVEPWVSPATVLAAFLKGRDYAGTEKHLSTKGLEVFRFDTAQTAQGLSIRGRHQRWDKTFPEKAYRNRQNFKQALDTARRVVLGRPKSAIKPKTVRENKE